MYGTQLVTTLYVAQGGSDAASGVTAAAPLATLQEAVNRLAFTGGGTILASGTLDPFTFTGHHAVTVDEATAGVGYTVDGTGEVASLVVHSNTAALTVRNGTFSGGTAGVVLGAAGKPAGSGLLVAEDCTASGTSNGWATEGVWTSFDATRCTGLGADNDGFNFHTTTGRSPTATLTDCVGDDCADEGVSPHEDVVLTIVGGHFDRNGGGPSANLPGGGMVAIQTAVCNISGGAAFRDNTGYGVAFLDTSTGTLGDYTSTGNSSGDLLPSA